MTGPDGTQSDNESRVRGQGTVHQVGSIGGDAHIRTTRISLGAFGVVVGMVMTLVVGFAVWKLVATNGQQNGTPAASSTTRKPPDGLRSREIALHRGQGVDVDDVEGKPADAKGATDDVDLYLDEYDSLRPYGGSFAEDSGHEDDAQQRCATAIAGRKNTLGPMFPVAQGKQQCFVTSDRQVAWLRVEITTLSSGSTDAEVVLTVRVWPRS